MEKEKGIVISEGPNRKNKNSTKIGPEMGPSRQVLKEMSKSNNSTGPNNGVEPAHEMNAAAHAGNLLISKEGQHKGKAILNKENHSVYIPFESGSNKPNKENNLNSQRMSSSLIHRTGRGRGRPPDDKNVVILKRKIVVKKVNTRSRVFKSTVNLPNELLEDNEEDTIEGGDMELKALLCSKGKKEKVPLLILCKIIYGKENNGLELSRSGQ